MKNLGRLFAAACAAVVIPAAHAEIQCSPSAVPASVRAEGLAEPVGDIILTCTGSVNEQVTNALSVFLTVNITNRLANNTFDVGVALDGAAAPVTVRPNGANGLSVTNLVLRIPPAGRTVLRISGIRAAVAQQGVENTTPITATLAFARSDAPALTRSELTVGVPRRGLRSAGNAGAVDCYGSPVPEAISVPSLFAAGTRVFSTRVSEGFTAAFLKAAAGGTGTRILMRFSGLPPGARLFVPDFVAGSSAARPTSGGDLDLAGTGGRYQTGGAGSLLLALVPDADETGAGGDPLVLAGVGEVELTAAREIARSAVYEVVDADPAALENAHIPVFFGMPPTGGQIDAAAAKMALTLAPLSTVATASETAPVPRFVEATPALDCTTDCNLFPRLFVNAPKPFTFTALTGGKKQSEYASVENAGGGNLAWSTTISYRNGSGWVGLYAEPNRGAHPGWFRVDVDPSRLAPGEYNATLTIDAGPTAGSHAVPIRLTVAPNPAPGVTSAVNAASFAAGPLVPGSIATIFGERLGGTNVAVTFDGIAATLFYTSATQINLLVPAELRGRPTAQLVVTSDGRAGAVQTVTLGAMNPAVFANGVLNQNWSVNSESEPAAAGSVLQIFATGLPSPEDGAVVVKFGNTDVTSLEYVGAAPGFPGLWQVNVRAQAGDLSLCGVSRTSTERVCSPVMKVYLR
jgi:uncharacterized protein (TIGR03437 family)